MMFGDFSESKSNEIELPYDSAILRFVVKYCCSDKMPNFKEEELDKLDNGMVRIAVNLCAAADYFELEGLSETLTAGLVQRLSRERGWFSACVVLDEAMKSKNASLVSASLQVIQMHTKRTLGSKYKGSKLVTMLGPEALTCLVEQDWAKSKAITLFLAIQDWLKAALVGGTVENPTEVAKICASKIDLRFIESRELFTIVKDSGLVENESIFEAVAKQAAGTNPPVYVTGAGIPSVNGLYEYAPFEEGNRFAARYSAWRYAKQGELDGEPVTFYIHAVLSPEYGHDAKNDKIWDLEILGPPHGVSRPQDKLGFSRPQDKLENRMLYKCLRREDNYVDECYSIGLDAADHGVGSATLTFLTRVTSSCRPE